MEVGEETADDLKSVARAEEDAGLAGVWLKRISCSDLRAMLERASGRRPGSDDASTCGQSGVYRMSGGCGERVVLCMEAYVFQRFSADWLEGSKTNVQRDGFNLDAVCFELAKDLRGEVQASRWSSGAANFIGEDGLIAVAILEAVVPVNVRGERHVAYFIEDGVEVECRSEAQSTLAELSGGQNFSFEYRFALARFVEEETLAGLDLAAGADECGPVVRSNVLREKNFDAACRI